MAEAPRLKRASIFFMHLEDGPSPNYQWVQQWLERWDGAVRVADYSTGGWEHTWDVEGPPEAIAEIPQEWLCISEWSMKPYPPAKERKDRRHGRR